MPKTGTRRVRLAVMLAAAMITTAAPATNVSAAPESPASALSRHIRVLAASPRDFNALIGAGRAALELGDVQAAAGFFGRAEEAYPTAPAPKAGLGAAMAHMGDADGAIYYFDQATRLGASALAIALERGLARDLNGDLAGAQGDYRLAIQSLNSDEGRRRLALSLAIGRDRAGAIAAIQPLLNRRDPAAQRTRAFVLALVGDQAGAAQAIESVMPGGSARFAPFFTYLPHLSVQEKAAAVHLGMFPDNAAQRVAAVQSAPAPPLAAKTTPPLGQGRAPARVAEKPVQPPAPAEPVRLASNQAGTEPSGPSFSLPSSAASPAPSAASSSAFILPSAASAAPAAGNEAQSNEDAGSAMADAERTGGKLSGIDRLLETIAEPPPAPTPKVERPRAERAGADSAAGDAAARKAAEKKAAEKKAAEKKARDAKLAAEKKAREEAARLGVKGTYWVQLAGGSNQDRMAGEYKRLGAKAGSLLKSRPGYVTEGKEYFRLVVGPFDSKAESQAFVNRLAKEGVDSFSWTRTPSQIKIEKISAK